jgi:hypothetical protein
MGSVGPPRSVVCWRTREVFCGNRSNRLPSSATQGFRGGPSRTFDGLRDGGRRRASVHLRPHLFLSDKSSPFWFSLPSRCGTPQRVPDPCRRKEPSFCSWLSFPSTPVSETPVLQFVLNCEHDIPVHNKVHLRHLLCLCLRLHTVLRVMLASSGSSGHSPCGSRF